MSNPNIDATLSAADLQAVKDAFAAVLGNRNWGQACDFAILKQCRKADATADQPRRQCTSLSVFDYKHLPQRSYEVCTMN